MQNHFVTLNETLNDQKDLSKLCQDRALETGEIFEPNAFYGMEFIIKSYSNIAFNTPLKVIYPHGINLSNNIWQAEKKSLVPVIYCYSPQRYNVYKTQTNKIVMRSASPFVYVSELLKTNPAPKRKGTIFFPPHSSHRVTVLMDFEKIATDLENLGDEYKPISICIYWRDCNLGYHKPFEKRGFKIVSAGHIYDPHFLFRLYHLCSTHHYAASNGVGGSSLFFSVKSGCSYFIMDQERAEYKASEKILSSDCLGRDPQICTLLLKLFKAPKRTLSCEQVNVVNELLGVKYLKTPDELKAELEFADRLDKFGFSRHPESKKMYYRMPNLIPRRLLRAIKRKLANRNKY